MTLVKKYIPIEVDLDGIYFASTLKADNAVVKAELVNEKLLITIQTEFTHPAAIEELEGVFETTVAESKTTKKDDKANDAQSSTTQTTETPKVPQDPTRRQRPRKEIGNKTSGQRVQPGDKKEG